MEDLQRQVATVVEVAEVGPGHRPGRAACTPIPRCALFKRDSDSSLLKRDFDSKARPWATGVPLLQTCSNGTPFGEKAAASAPSVLCARTPADATRILDPCLLLRLLILFVPCWTAACGHLLPIQKVICSSYAACCVLEPDVAAYSGLKRGTA